MPYKALYRRRQDGPEYLPRQWYLDDARELSWVKSIDIVVDPALRKEASQGLIIREKSEIVGGLPRFPYKIILADGLSIQKERFITIKELMHCYFGPTPENEKYTTDSEVGLENHFRQFFNESATMSHSAHVKAESIALWMAVGVLCSAQQRREYLAQITDGLTYEEIAAKLIVPVKQVKNLISEQYHDEIAHILK